MSKLLDVDYDSEEDEDYAPTALEEQKADAELKAFQGGLPEDNEEGIEDKRPKLDEDIMKKWEEIIKASRECDNLFSAIESEDQAEDEDPSTSTEVPEGETSHGTKRKIVEVFDFYGESVTQEREVDEEEAKRIENRKAKSANKRPVAIKINGMDTLMKKIEKNPKMTVVDKSQLDWQRHVKKQKLEDDLSKYDRSKESFIDKSNFAQKASEAEYLLKKK